MNQIMNNTDKLNTKCIKYELVWIYFPLMCSERGKTMENEMKL